MFSLKGFITATFAALILVSGLAGLYQPAAQITNPGVQQDGSVTIGHCAVWGSGVGQLADAGAGGCGGTGGAALSTADDTNIHITATGTPATALLKAVTLTMSWSGTLALSRLAQGTDGQLIVGQTSAAPLYKTITGDWTMAASGASTLATVNSNVGTFGSVTNCAAITVNAKGLITAASDAICTPAASSITGGAALTRTSDTNVTLTLGGAPTTALLTATSITAGWSGQLSIARGGTGQATQQAAFDALAPTATVAGSINYWDGTHWVKLDGNAVGTKVLQETSSGVPSWVAAGTGTVTSAVIAGTSGNIDVSGTCTITTTGTCTANLGASRLTAPTISKCGSGLTCDGASHTITKPSGALWVEIFARGASGGGGGCQTTGVGSFAASGGGGQGGYVYHMAAASDIVYTVGTKGTGGAANTIGNAGSTATVTDVGTVSAGVGSGGAAGPAATGGYNAGGDGGAASGGSFTAQGAPGTVGILVYPTWAGAGQGGNGPKGSNVQGAGTSAAAGSQGGGGGCALNTSLSGVAGGDGDNGALTLAWHYN